MNKEQTKQNREPNKEQPSREPGRQPSKEEPNRKPGTREQSVDKS